MKFNHLNVPDQWQHYWTKYPEGYTILEALISWVSQVDSMVDNQNTLNENVKQFRNEIDEFVGRFDERLQDEVTKTLQDWQESGFLDVVINEALDTKYHEMDNRLTTQLAQTASHVDTTFKNSISDKIRKVVSDTASGTANGVFIEVGDSTRAINGAHIFSYLSNELSKYNVRTHLVARSGLKTEHWSKYTPNMQPGFPTVDDVITLIPGDGTNTIVDICLGINDGSKTQEQMQLYLQTGINAILSAKPNVLINLTSPNRYSDAKVVNKLINIYKNLSDTGKYGYINVLENVFKTWNSDVQETYFVDATHPNVLGQSRMADYIIPKFLPNYKTTGLQNDLKVLTTGDVPVNYYVELATITLKRQYYGFNGTIIVQASPGDGRIPTNAMFVFSLTQYTPLGTDAAKEVTLKTLVNEGNTLNFTKDSLVLRTVSVSPSETVVKIYLKNKGGSGRNFKVVFFGTVNGSQDYTDVTISNQLNGRISMDVISSGTTDVSASYNKYSYLSSPDGSLFKIAIDNSGNLSGTKV